MKLPRSIFLFQKRFLINFLKQIYYTIYQLSLAQKCNQIFITLFSSKIAQNLTLQTYLKVLEGKTETYTTKNCFGAFSGMRCTAHLFAIQRIKRQKSLYIFFCVSIQVLILDIQLSYPVCSYVSYSQANAYSKVYKHDD